MYCIWLTFISPDISEYILKLAHTYDGPAFQPHCTLLGKTDITLQRIKLAVIESNYKPIDVHPANIKCSDNIWRTMYIVLAEKKVLTKWHKDICDSLDIEYDNEYIPHISLMYNTIPIREKEILSDKIKLKSAYKIQSIQIIDCSGEVDEWKPVFELKI